MGKPRDKKQKQRKGGAGGDDRPGKRRKKVRAAVGLECWASRHSSRHPMQQFQIAHTHDACMRGNGAAEQRLLVGVHPGSDGCW